MLVYRGGADRPLENVDDQLVEVLEIKRIRMHKDEKKWERPQRGERCG